MAGGGDVAVLGVDVGGTKVAVAAVNAQGTSSATAGGASAVGSAEAFLAGLGRRLRRALSPSPTELRAVGLACAGTVDHAHGVVVTSPNLPLDGFLCSQPAAALGMSVVLENDANAATWAEAVIGAAAGHRHVVMLALGTGVGGGFSSTGRIYRGSGGGAAELGHVVCAGGECARAVAIGVPRGVHVWHRLGRLTGARQVGRRSDPEGTVPKC